MFLDADTPSDTSQIDVTFRLDSETVTLRVRQIDPGCAPGPDDACLTYRDSTLSPRPAGVAQFSMAMQPQGSRTRVVVQNLSADTSIAVTLTVAPRRAGWT